MTRGDIHNLQGSLKNVVKDIQNSDQISERDKNILVNGTEEAPSFLTYMQNKDHSISRIVRYLRTTFRMVKREEWSIEEVDKNKITSYVGKLQSDQYRKKNGEEYSDSTKREIKKGIRKLYIDYVENHVDVLDFPDDFKGEEIITFTLTINRSYTDPDRLPNPNTVKELVQNTSRIRNKAYIMLLWSTGGRNGEILGLKWKDVKFTNNIGQVVFKETKTGGDHKVPMGEAYPFVYKHRENDPRGSDPEAFVFRSLNSDNQLSSGAINNMIKRIKNKEGTQIPARIKVNPHAFRKGRASYWARQEKNESWICRHMNWAQGSKIVRHYCRMAQDDLDQGVAEHLQLKHEEDNKKEESKTLTPSECHKCSTINGFDTDTCMECGETLQTSKLYKEAKVQEMKEEVKSEMIEKNIGKSREEIRKIAEKAVEGAHEE